MRNKKSAACMLGLALAVSVAAEAEQPKVLKLPLFPVPIAGRNMPLDRALSLVGAYVQNGYALFGIELHLRDESEPAVNLNLQPASTLGDALHQVFQQLPDYTFDVVSEHIIEVYPVNAKRDPGDLLNLSVPRFDAVQAQPGDILSRPADFIPELMARIVRRRPGESEGVVGGPLRGVGPAVTLHLRNATVRQILNAVSEATEQFPANYSPLGWVYRFQPNPSLPGGGAHTWSYLWSAPHDWKKQSQK